MNPPKIDGLIEASEWNFASSKIFNIAGGWVIAQNDSSNLYLLIELPDAKGPANKDDDDPSCLMDSGLGILIDANRDKKITMNEDFAYAFYFANNEQRSKKQYTSKKIKFPDLVYEFAYGAMPSLSGAKIGLGNGETPRLRTNHLFWEVSIPLAEISQPGRNSINVSFYACPDGNFNLEYDDDHRGGGEPNVTVAKKTLQIEFAGNILDTNPQFPGVRDPLSLQAIEILEDGSVSISDRKGGARKISSEELFKSQVPFADGVKMNAPPNTLPTDRNDARARPWLSWLNGSILEMIATRVSRQSVQNMLEKEKNLDLYETVYRRLYYLSLLRPTN